MAITLMYAYHVTIVLMFTMTSHRAPANTPDYPLLKNHKTAQVIFQSPPHMGEENVVTKGRAITKGIGCYQGGPLPSGRIITKRMGCYQVIRA